MKKRLLQGILLTAMVCVCCIIYVNVSYKYYDLTLPGKIITVNNKELLIEGFPQNPKGRRGTYSIENNRKIVVYDIEDSQIPFDELKPGDYVVIYYIDKAPKAQINKEGSDLNILLGLKDNQRIPRVISISIFSPPLRQNDILIPNGE